MRYLGKIEIPAGTAVNNTNTTTPFSISGSFHLELNTDDDKLVYEQTADDTNPSTFATTAATGAKLLAGFERPVAAGRTAAPCVISVFNSGAVGATVKVYSLPAR